MTWRCLVTGASGFIGGHLVAALSAQGAEVHCLVRPTSRLDRLRPYSPKIIAGDLGDPTTLRSAVAGVDCIFHLAGRVKALDPQEFHQANYRGTLHLLQAVRAAGPPYPRVVLVSSLAACGPSRPGAPRAEDDPPAPCSPYGLSKLRAELAALAFPEIPWTVVRPPVVYGPADTETLAFFRTVARGLLPRLSPATELSLVYVTDLVEGLLRAARAPQAVHRHYFLADPQVYRVAEVLTAVARVLGVRPVPVPVPYPLGWLAGLGSELWARLRRQPTAFDRAKVREMHQPAWTCQTERAAAELDFRAQVPLVEGLRQAAEWYRAHGWL